MSAEQELLIAFELHSVEGIARALRSGVRATDAIDGRTPVEHLIEMYTRSPNFADCLRVLLDGGAVIDDPLLRAVLLDEPTVPAGDVQHPLSIVAAYTCCRGVTALHLCAEFNSVRCARALLAAGVDVNTRAAVDETGFGGQTPLFHTVNSNGNYSRPMLELLIDAGADLDVRLKGLKWGEGMDWETLLFDVTVFSYAQCGLYRQFHRQERDIYSNLALMYERRYRSVAPIRNVPNKYLAS